MGEVATMEPKRAGGLLLDREHRRCEEGGCTDLLKAQHGGRAAREVPRCLQSPEH